MNATVHHKVVRVECPRAGIKLEFKRSGDMDCSKQPQYLGNLKECCDVCPFTKQARKAAIQELDLNFWGAR